MLKFKLIPFGKKHQIHYRICVAQENSKLTGNVLEILGHYHPLHNHELTLDANRIIYWQKLGVQPTGRVRKILNSYAKIH